MTLRTDLEALVADWPYPEAKKVVRIADVLSGKDDTYRRSRGRARIERELADDGLSSERIDAVILSIEGEKEIDLDHILADLIARERVGHL